MNNYAKMIIAMFFIVLTTATDAGAHEKVPIREVTSLLLHRGKMTTGRRSSPVPQLTCLSNCRGAPDTIYCSNAGHDGVDVVWECKSDPAGAVFRDLNIQCEGYEYPDDPYILKGSCGIEFRMTPSHPSSPIYSTTDPEPNPMGALYVFIIAMVIISCMMNDASGGSSSYRSSYSPRYRSSSSDFWTGAATGYAVGRSGGSSSWGGGGSGSSWGGGGSSYASTSRR